jgi:hypothetical protein
MADRSVIKLYQPDFELLIRQPNLRDGEAKPPVSVSLQIWVLPEFNLISRSLSGSHALSSVCMPENGPAYRFKLQDLNPNSFPKP